MRTTLGRQLQRGWSSQGPRRDSRGPASAASLRLGSIPRRVGREGCRRSRLAVGGLGRGFARDQFQSPCLPRENASDRSSAPWCGNCDSLALDLDYKKLKKSGPLFPQKTAMNHSTAPFRDEEGSSSLRLGPHWKGVTCSMKPFTLEPAELGRPECGQARRRSTGRPKEPLARWIQGRKLVENK